MGDISKKSFGKLAGGSEVSLFTLTNDNGVMAEITNYGGKIVRLLVPDKTGKLSDVVLGFNFLEDYLKPNPYLGTLVGRCANRIRNGEFYLEGIKYELEKNRNGHSLHSGNGGYDKVLLTERLINDNDKKSLELSFLSPDGQDGYPGNLELKVEYELTNENELKISYFATSDKTTIVNLTNHCYFNLSGEGSGTVLNHEAKIFSSFYTPVDKELIPTGEIKDVCGTAFDFTKSRAIGSRIDSEKLSAFGGYDINYVLSSGRELHKAAEVYDPSSGRFMEVSTTMPGIQFYSGNFLEGTFIGKSGKPYEKHSGFCLETQNYPNAVNIPHFPSPVLRKSEIYDHSTVYKFSVK